MQHILENLKFTRKSILILFIVVLGIIGTIAVTCGFNDRYHICLSTILISVTFCLWLIYAIVVHRLYYKLPKNRNKSEMGVLFIIDTHGNAEEYKAIKDKFIENFEELSGIIESNIVNPIILSKRHVKAFKNKIYKKEILKGILLKAKCTFAVYLKATDEGQKSSTYELKLTTIMVHDEFNRYLQPIFEANYNYIFKDIRISTIDKTKDLSSLKLQSTQLYLICQLLFGVAKTYSGYPVEAIEVLNCLLIKIERNKDNFSENLKRILFMEIFSDFLVITNKEYKKYICGEDYNFELAKKSSSIVYKFLNKVHSNYFIDYYLQSAIYNLLSNDIVKAKEDINILRRKFSNIKQENRIWNYSEAFLLACENNPAKYEKIINNYKRLKNNYYPAKDIQDFIFRYINDHPNNLGVKIALCALVYYRDDLDINIIPKAMAKEIIAELEQQNFYSISKLIKDMYENG